MFVGEENPCTYFDDLYFVFQRGARDEAGSDRSARASEYFYFFKHKNKAKNKSNLNTQ